MAETRDRIVSATTELFRRQGFNGTSLKQITVASEAPTGSVYHYFPGGKQELAKAVIETSGAAYLELFEMIADDAGNMAAAVSDFFEGAAALLEETIYIDPCPIGTVAREVAGTNETLREATNLVFSSWVNAAATRFTAMGLARAEADELATTVIAALEGGFVLARAAHDAETLRATGRQVRRLVDLALTAASKRGHVGNLQQ